tara:strand:- start:5970 stop:6521 length:552 start_codon:yes stop_codon:yes gene_type:complete
MKPKPEQETRTKLDWHNCQKYIEDKHDIRIRDYGRPEHAHLEYEKEGFGSVYASPQEYEGKNYAWIDGKGEKVEVTKKQYKEEFEKYYARCKAFKVWKEEKYGVEAPYMDFWHYLIDVNYDVSNGCYIWIPKKVAKDNSYAKIGEGTQWEGWVQKITELIFEEFGEYADVDGGEEILEVWVDW